MSPTGDFTPHCAGCRCFDGARFFSTPEVTSPRTNAAALREALESLMCDLFDNYRTMPASGMTAAERRARDLLNRGRLAPSPGDERTGP